MISMRRQAQESDNNDKGDDTDVAYRFNETLSFHAAIPPSEKTVVVS